MYSVNLLVVVLTVFFLTQMEFVENATDFKLPIFYVCPMDFDFVKIYENFCKKNYGTVFSL